MIQTHQMLRTYEHRQVCAEACRRCESLQQLLRKL